MKAQVPAPTDPRGAARWWVYQRERFPVVGHGALIAAFSFCAVAYSAQLRALAAAPAGRAGESAATGLPAPVTLIVAFVSCMLFFLQLRIADEFKDFEEDLAHRPYRPVQRGLVSLRELAMVFLAAGAVQFVLALAYEPRLLVLLLVVWFYLAMMGREFFMGGWLRARPVVYMLSHMLIMPLIDLYATAAEWSRHQPLPPAGLAWFLAASYGNGLVIELGRKIRAPADEEAGVSTYSALWGRRRAVGAWLAAMTGSMGAALLAAARIGTLLPVAVVLLAVAIAATIVAVRFLRSERPRSGRAIERMAGIWTIILYLALGGLPLLIR